MTRKITLLCLLAVFLLGTLFVPEGLLLQSASSGRALGVGIFLMLIFGFQIANQERNTKVYSVDFWWVVLIVFSGLSTLWSINPTYAIYGTLTTTLIYLCYKAFETIDWEVKQVRDYLFWAAGFSLVIALCLQIYFLKESIGSDFSAGHLTDTFVLSTMGINQERLASLILILLPFILFSNKAISRYIGPLILATSVIVSIASDLIEVTILLMLVSVIYTLYTVSYKSNYKYFVLIGFLGLLISALYMATYHISSEATGDTSFMMEKYGRQFTRVQILDHSTHLFSNSPFIGHGKNNWEPAYQNYISRNSSTLGSTEKIHPNCSLQSILCEGGIIGMIIYAYIGILPFLRLFNERALLSKVEIAASVSLMLFGIVTLVYGSTYNGYNAFYGLPIIAALSLAILSSKSNASVFLLESKSYYWKVAFILAAALCTIYFIRLF